VYPVGQMSRRKVNQDRQTVPRIPPAIALARTVNAEHVQTARSNMPLEADIANLADVFKLLGEPSRVRILIALLNGPMCVRDLAAAIDLSESAASHALRLLRAHRVVEVHRSGRVAHYEIADSHVRVLLELGLEHVDHTIMLHAAPPTAPSGTFNGQTLC